MPCSPGGLVWVTLPACRCPAQGRYSGNGNCSMRPNTRITWLSYRLQGSCESEGSRAVQVGGEDMLSSHTAWVWFNTLFLPSWVTPGQGTQPLCISFLIWIMGMIIPTYRVVWGITWDDECPKLRIVPSSWSWEMSAVRLSEITWAVGISVLLWDGPAPGN